MTLRKQFFILAVLIFIASCSSHLIRPNQITVVVSENVQQDLAKKNALDNYRVDFYLHKYLREFAIDYDLDITLERDSSFTIETTITDIHIGSGRDRMETETLVKRNGQIVDTLNFDRSTGRRGVGKRLAEALAKDIMSSLGGR